MKENSRVAAGIGTLGLEEQAQSAETKVKDTRTVVLRRLMKK